MLPSEWLGWWAQSLHEKMGTSEAGHVEECHGVSFMRMKMLSLYGTLPFIMANYSADAVASECTGVVELTWV